MSPGTGSPRRQNHVPLGRDVSTTFTKGGSVGIHSGTLVSVTIRITWTLWGSRAAPSRSTITMLPNAVLHEGRKCTNRPAFHSLASTRSGGGAGVSSSDDADDADDDDDDDGGGGGGGGGDGGGGGATVMGQSVSVTIRKLILLPWPIGGTQEECRTNRQSSRVIKKGSKAYKSKMPLASWDDPTIISCPQSAVRYR